MQKKQTVKPFRLLLRSIHKIQVLQEVLKRLLTVLSERFLFCRLRLKVPYSRLLNFAKSGIRVNAIAPGWFQTAQNKTLLLNEDGSLTERSKKVIAHTPMDRFGVPEDLVGTMLYLADDSLSGFVTGAMIPVDGGFQAYFGV